MPPNFVSEGGVPLRGWINSRRTEYTRGALSAERIAELNALGMVRDPRDDDWRTGIAAAREYRSTHGHLFVPAAVASDGYPVGTWIVSRRFEHKRGRLPLERVTELDALGMVAAPTASAPLALVRTPTTTGASSQTAWASFTCSARSAGSVSSETWNGASGCRAIPRMRDIDPSNEGLRWRYRDTSGGGLEVPLDTLPDLRPRAAEIDDRALLVHRLLYRNGRIGRVLDEREQLLSERRRAVQTLVTANRADLHRLEELLATTAA